MSHIILPEPIEGNGFNSKAIIPFGVTTAHIHAAMQDFIDFATAVDTELHAKGMASLEDTMMQANFSSLVGEMMVARIPKHCPTVVKNLYHNGHPDVLPAGKYRNNKAQHASRGIEIKASRYSHGWQGHNAEDVWLLVFVFQSGRAGPKVEKPQAFKFLFVAGARLAKADWQFSGRSETSRRTITASVSKAGAEKVMANWIYKCAELRQGKG
jgi:hypothetical protein